MNMQRPISYRIERAGFRFELPAAEVDRLRKLPDFETREEPALADDFLRFRADGWAENLTDAGAAPGPVVIKIDTHQKKSQLYRGEDLLFSADI
jgi:hypothetical protein